MKTLDDAIASLCKATEREPSPGLYDVIAIAVELRRQRDRLRGLTSLFFLLTLLVLVR